VKWPLVILNLGAAVGLVFLGSFAVAAHRTHAFSTYQELKKQGVLIEKPGFSVEQRLGSIGNGGSYSKTIAQIGAGVLVINALLIGFYWTNPKG
jgi:hypothetical protein